NLEGLRLAAVSQGEGVHGGSGGRYPEAAARLEVGGEVDAGYVGRERCGDSRLLVGATGTPLDGQPITGGDVHAGGGRGDGTVVVQNAEENGLEDHRLGECRLDGENR